MDPQARFEEIYRAYADHVHAYARRRSTSATADDVVAEVFLVAWRRLGQVPEEPLPWLLAVARRVLANGRRAEGRAAALRDRLVGSYRPSTEAAATGDDRTLRALAGLGEHDRELLLLSPGRDWPRPTWPRCSGYALGRWRSGSTAPVDGSPTLSRHRMTTF